ncbi:MFS family permease [Microbacterium terrae]|uniref:Major Facilitator Superfamily protein n=1 Tax=Microbacterium terrae TaxID=69369 RepID=A0A0M2GVI8_9MICO|nr:MFS transporter [Microbacterium terrae]KJL37532.1 Major Facilitator Superfamily protein [Microbacterium terrae]MBP1076361.1 MFS family permease [Microbacterium terrae]GLJ97185.1 MFS transporter [Microbacterium terrae]
MTVVDTTTARVVPWSGSTTDVDQPKPPLRVGVAVALGILLVTGPYMGVNAVLLPARVAEIDPEGKATALAVISTVSMVVATLANIVVGALSDGTRSRWGRRSPWMIVGSIGTAVMLAVIPFVGSLPMLMVVWAVMQLFLNSAIAPIIAVIADRVAPRHRGTISSIYSLGFSGGIYGGQILGAQFLGDVTTGFFALAGLLAIAGPLCVVLMREQSSLDMPPRAFTWSAVRENFTLPTTGSRDYYLALFGKLTIVAAKFAISGYMLYILTDYMLLAEDQTAQVLSLVSLLLMLTAFGMGAIAGPVSDKLKRRRLPVITAAVLIAVGAMFPFFAAEPWALLVYGAIAGIGMGAFNSVDQALNIEVLPNPDTAAKDLGILNLANTGGQVLGPILAAAAIGFVGYHGIFPLAAALAILGAIPIFMIRTVR